MQTWMTSQIAAEIEPALEQALKLASASSGLLSIKKQQPCFSLGYKTSFKNRFGELEQVLLFGQASWPDGTLPAVQDWACQRLEQLQAIFDLDDLAPDELVSLIAEGRLRLAPPAASAYALLHAAHPARFTCFSQPQAALVASSQALTLPFESDLRTLCRQIRQRSKQASPLVLANRGLLTGGETLAECLSEADAFAGASASQVSPAEQPDKPAVDPESRRSLLTELRFKLGAARNRPLVLHLVDSPAMRLFAASPAAQTIAQVGLPYPDFATRTGTPLLLSQDLGELARLPEESPLGLNSLLLPDLGLVTAGDSFAQARRAAELFQAAASAYQTTANSPDFQPPTSQEIRHASEWEGLTPGSRLPFSGEIAVVTGSASGIGKAVADALLRRGSAVLGLDINPAIQTTFDHASYFGMVCDVSREEDICAALGAVVDRFGGLDMLILNAGLFPGGCNISKTRLDEFSKVIDVNFSANVILMREAYPLLSRAPRYGRVVMIGSKNFRAPGPGAAAYSTSKAALTQLARVAALEWAGDRIRVNVIHPDSVFDTALYTPEVLQARAAHYGMTVEQYKKRNLLKTEITSRDVAEMVAEMCGPLFYHMTGGQIQFDGGNDRTL